MKDFSISFSRLCRCIMKQQQHMMDTCSSIWCVAILLMLTIANSPVASSDIHQIRGAASGNKLPSPYQEGFQQLANRKQWGELSSYALEIPNAAYGISAKIWLAGQYSMHSTASWLVDVGKWWEDNFEHIHASLHVASFTQVNSRYWPHLWAVGILPKFFFMEYLPILK